MSKFQFCPYCGSRIITGRKNCSRCYKDLSMLMMNNSLNSQSKRQTTSYSTKQSSYDYYDYDEYEPDRSDTFEDRVEQWNRYHDDDDWPELLQ